MCASEGKMEIISLIKLETDIADNQISFFKNKITLSFQGHQRKFNALFV